MEIRKAALLAAGRGQRLGALTAATPKPLLKVGGRPLIQWIIEALQQNGIDEFVVVGGYLGQQLESFCKHLASHAGLTVAFARQPQLDGTGGAMLAAEALLGDAGYFVLGWGDILMDSENYQRFMSRANRPDYDLLMAVNRTSDPWRGAAVYLDPQMKVQRLVEKPPQGTSTTNWNNAGLFACRRELLDYVRKLERSPRGEYELPAAVAAMIEAGARVMAVDVRGFWSDVGTAEDLELANRHYLQRNPGDQ